MQVEQEKVANRGSIEEVAEWSLGVENKQTAADVNIEYLKRCIAEGKQGDNLVAKETKEAILQESRNKQLQFEQTQLEMKLAYEKKREEAKTSHAKTTEPSQSQMETAKLPKLVIPKFRGELTDWPRFWSQLEAEIDRAEVPGVTKYSYLKELVDPKIRKEIDGLPFSSEGYERAKNILKRKYGKPSEVVNAHVENIMSLPTINGFQPNKINEFYEKLLFKVHSLEKMGKLQEVNGYVRMTIDKRPGITGDLVRTDDSWQEWNFPQLVDELSKWTQRNPIQTKSNEKPLRDKSYQTQQKDERGRECVYCEKPDHRSVDCKTVTTLDERKRLLSNKRLCFNCTGSKHRAVDCRNRSL